MPLLTPLAEPDVTVMPSAEAYDFDSFRTRVDAELLARSIAIRVFRMPLLAVPVGRTRRGGWFGVDHLAIATAVRDVLTPFGGFPDPRIIWQHTGRGSYAVEWGERPPATWLNDDERRAFYGHKQAASGPPHTPSSVVCRWAPTAP